MKGAQNKTNVDSYSLCLILHQHQLEHHSKQKQPLKNLATVGHFLFFCSNTSTVSTIKNHYVLKLSSFHLTGKASPTASTLNCEITEAAVDSSLLYTQNHNTFSLLRSPSPHLMMSFCGKPRVLPLQQLFLNAGNSDAEAIRNKSSCKEGKHCSSSRGSLLVVKSASAEMQRHV